VQHLGLVPPAQSASAWQSVSPAEACSQTLGAPGARLRVSQPSPWVVLQLESEVQMRGQLAPDWQTFPPVP
jgi:hypothetical protein